MTANPKPALRERTLALLRRHGWNATSFQVLEPDFRYWFGAPDACVAYVDTGGAWVAAGAPIGPPDGLATAAAGFVAAARAARRRACFFGTEPRFAADPALGPASETPLASMRIGEQPIWDPATWRATVGATPSLRAQLSRARGKGVLVRALPATELRDAQAPTRAAVEALIGRWLASRRLPPMGFLLQMDAFSFLEERRCFVAEQGGRLVGFLMAVPVYARGGWLLEDLVRDPASPNGTPELLIDAALRAAADEGSRYVTLGLAPLSGPVGWWLRLARRSGRGFYHFEGLRAFKAKLRPADWVSIYLSYPAGQWGARAVLDTLAAFARGRLARFALETLLRRRLRAGTAA
jgi:phosphatidylglycerol lysyltransferase